MLLTGELKNLAVCKRGYRQNIIAEDKAAVKAALGNEDWRDQQGDTTCGGICIPFFFAGNEMVVLELPGLLYQNRKDYKPHCIQAQEKQVKYNCISINFLTGKEGMELWK